MRDVGFYVSFDGTGNRIHRASCLHVTTRDEHQTTAQRWVRFSDLGAAGIAAGANATLCQDCFP